MSLSCTPQAWHGRAHIHTTLHTVMSLIFSLDSVTSVEYEILSWFISCWSSLSKLCFVCLWVNQFTRLPCILILICTLPDYLCVWLLAVNIWKMHHIHWSGAHKEGSLGGCKGLMERVALCHSSFSYLFKPRFQSYCHLNTSSLDKNCIFSYFVFHVLYTSFHSTHCLILIKMQIIPWVVHISFSHSFSTHTNSSSLDSVIELSIYHIHFLYILKDDTNPLQTYIYITYLFRAGC